MLNSLNKMVSLMLVIVFFTSQSGCSFLAGSTQPFSVSTTEPDAQIFINGSSVGVGNVQTIVKRDQSVSVMATKEGYYPVTRDIGTKMSSLAILDIIGGCFFLIPFIGLAAPGAKELDQNSVSLSLQKSK